MLQHIVRCIYLAYHQDLQGNDTDGVASVVEAMCASILAKLTLSPQLGIQVQMLKSSLYENVTGVDSAEYNLYGSERLRLSTPQQRTLPVTGTTVATLYKSLGACVLSC